MIYYIIILIILCFNTIVSEAYIPFHQQELNKNRIVTINYKEVDRLANSLNYNQSIRSSLSHKIIGYLPYWQYDQYPFFDYNLISQINYFSVELSQYGDIINFHGLPEIGFISFAQDRGVKVLISSTLFGSSLTTELLNNSGYRQNAISNLINIMLSSNADGLDIDFEPIDYSQRENLVTFISDLKIQASLVLPEVIITMASPAIDWWGSWDYESLAQICDHLFIMAYDYHWSGSENAGPVSPLGGFFYDLEYSIYDYLDLTNGNAEKLILGVPYYGYDWMVIDDQIYSLTTSSANSRIYSEAINLADTYGNLWDNNSNSNWISYQNSDWRQCWHDDSLSLSIKYEFAKDNNLSGIGIWALGYDAGNLELWGALSDHFISCDPYGDINYDQSIDILDIIVIVNYILNEIEFNNNQFCSSDINFDGLIDIIDIIEIINIILDRYR